MSARAFSRMSNKLERILSSEVYVSACDPARIPEGHVSRDAFREYQGLWDTGASASVITQKVVDDLGLAPVDLTTVCHAQGKATVEVYLVAFGMPNHVAIPTLRVTKGILGDFDVLIGMDVIGLGDFAVSNHMGRTAFTFRIPSLAHAVFPR